MTHMCQDLGAREALGYMLVQALLERHGALPMEVECGVLLVACLWRPPRSNTYATIPCAASRE